jgi:cobalamin biosynthesis protein CbiD
MRVKCILTSEARTTTTTTTTTTAAAAAAAAAAAEVKQDPVPDVKKLNKQVPYFSIVYFNENCTKHFC